MNIHPYDQMYKFLMLNESIMNDISEVDYGKYEENKIYKSQVSVIRTMFYDTIIYCHKGNASKAIECGTNILKVPSCLKVLEVANEDTKLVEALKDLNIQNDKPMFIRKFLEDIQLNINTIESTNLELNRKFMGNKTGTLVRAYTNVVSNDKAQELILSSFCDICSVDITMDIGAIFNKSEVFLLLNNCKDSLLKKLNKDSNTTKVLIMESGKYVGNDCILAYIKNKADNRTLMRIKIYNKFAQELQTYSNQSSVGCMLNKILTAPTKEHLKSKNIGYSRVEITLLEPEDIYNSLRHDMIMKIVMNILSDIWFECSLAKQWKSFADELHNSVLIINRQEKCVMLAMWYNSLTKRIGGSFQYYNGTFCEEHAIKNLLFNNGKFIIIRMDNDEYELECYKSSEYISTAIFNKNHIYDSREMVLDLGHHHNVIWNSKKISYKRKVNIVIHRKRKTRKRKARKRTLTKIESDDMMKVINDPFDYTMVKDNNIFFNMVKPMYNIGFSDNKISDITSIITIKSILLVACKSNNLFISWRCLDIENKAYNCNDKNVCERFITLIRKRIVNYSHYYKVLLPRSNQKYICKLKPVATGKIQVIDF